MRKSHILTFTGLFTSTLACGGAQHDDPSGIAFATPVVMACGNGSDSTKVVQGDFNGDHRPDIVGCLYEDSVAVFLNQGGGTFTGAQPVSLPQMWSASDFPSADVVQVHDINGDGFDDLVRVTQVEDSVESEIVFSHGDGTFAAPVVQPAYPYDCDIGKYSFDAYADAVCYQQGNLVVEDMVSDGSATTAFTVPVPSKPNIADVDGDGKLDLVYALGSTVAVQLGQGGSSFGSTQVVVEATDPVGDIQLGDLDGDGLVDLVVPTGSSDLGWTYSFVHNKGNLTFETESELPQLDSFDDTFQDVTGDGLMDVVLTHDAQLLILVGHGDGTFDSTALLVTGPWNTVQNPLFVDLTGGGKPDLVVGGGNISIVLRQ